MVLGVLKRLWDAAHFSESKEFGSHPLEVGFHGILKRILILLRTGVPEGSVWNLAGAELVSLSYQKTRLVR